MGSRHTNATRLFHVDPGRLGRPFRVAPVLAGVHVSGIPIPPVMLWGHRLEQTVTLARFSKEVCEIGNIHASLGIAHVHPLPGSRVRSSCTPLVSPTGRVPRPWRSLVGILSPRRRWRT